LKTVYAKKWWPQGMGEHQVHRIKIVLRLDGEVLSVQERTYAHRTIDLVQNDEDEGRSFFFRVNGKPVFVKGCNLVPPSMYPVTPDSVWVALVAQMKAAQMNMVRVWAGGIYPPESFFNACDTAGILVWQDFMIANMLPLDKTFYNGLEQELDDQIRRLSVHPSLALFCGNNELDVAWKNWGWQDRYHLHGVDSATVFSSNEEAWSNAFPKKMTDHAVYDRYTPTSPLSNWGNAKGLTEGDLHYWGLWHGDSTFSSFKNNVGRFVSEWGFQSYPDSALLAKYIDPNSLYLSSPAVARLQRSYKTDRPIWEAIERELGEERPTTLSGFIEASQRSQAKAYGMAIEAHLGAQPHCMGTLLWQLNDCWPGPSWSIIDYEGNPKPAYEVVKRLFSTEP